MHRRSLLKAATSVAAATILDHPLLADDAWSAELDVYVERARRDWGVPGAAIAVVQDDRVTLAKGFGVRDPGTAHGVTAHTIFGIASMTKAFAALSLALLVDERRLDWEDAVVSYLPDFKVLDPYVTREMTIRDVLSHRTGVRDSGLLEAAYPQPQLFERMRNLEQRAPFRSIAIYNNLLYRLPAAIVEAITARSWDTFVRERIFQPLGMRATQTSANDLASFTDVARMCRFSEGQVQPFPPRAFEREVSSAGSFYSTATDMAAWLRLHMASGAYDGRRLVSERSMAALRTPAAIEPIVDTAWGKVYSQTVTSTYALGWQVRDHRGHPVVEHGGRNNGTAAHIGYLPRQRVGVVVLANLGMPSPGFPDAVAYRLYDLGLGEPSVDWSRRALTQKPAESPAAEPIRVSGTSPSRPLEAYAGRYAHPLYGELRVAFGDSGLTLQWFGREGVTATLEHWQFETFRTRWRDVGYRLPPFMSFALDAHGSVVMLTADGIPGHFERTPALPQ